MGDKMPIQTYGFIGLGNMGYGMALNVRAKMPKSSKLIVCDVNTQQRDKFISETEGMVEAADTPKEVAEKCDVIITSLPNGAAVQKVFTDSSNGLLAASGDGEKEIFFLETSTIEVKTSNHVLQQVKDSGLGDFIDCPVSGGIPAARQGVLTFMVGGSQDLFARAKPVLSSMGREDNILFCGPPGAGLATKQINNYIANVSYVALCEGMNTGIRYGLDPKLLANAINVSSGMCWNSLHMNPVKGVQPDSSASRDFEGGFKTELAKGVTDMAVELMTEVGAKHVMANVLKDVYARAVSNPKCIDKECRSIYKLIAEDDGSDLGETKIV